MAKKKNRGKKTSGPKPSNSAVPDNSPSSAQGKADDVDTSASVGESSSASNHDKAEKSSVCLPSITAEPDGCKKQYGSEEADVKVGISKGFFV